ncbi:MAG: DUF2442 domain-containing protein [Actinomycetota bacterium]|nr:DUF2442 domain-containing protein [Actinomycetota bacterium]
MVPWVIKAKYIKDYKIWLAFNDGAEGEVDLSTELEGEIFEPLKDVSFFKNFKIIGHTLAWENGADFAPEFLREKITQTKQETA